MSQKITFLVLCSDGCTDLGQWVVNEVLGVHFSAVLGLHIEAAGTVVAAPPQATDDHFVPTAQEVIRALAPDEHLVVIAIFFDGLSDNAKDIFSTFRGFCASDRRIAVQALNAKRGTHTLRTNPAAVASSIAAKIPADVQAKMKISGAATSGPVETPTTALADVPMVKEEAAEVLTAEALAKKVREGQGEAYWLVAADKAAFAAQVEHLHAVATSIECGIFPLTAEPRELPAKGGQPAQMAQEFMVRRSVVHQHLEMRLAMCGNVDSGKSTLTSVLTRGERDDGRGSARSFVFNHKHEADTGRTSSISENHLGFTATGEVANYPKGGSCGRNSVTPNELSARSSKIVTLYDLAGHERYLKTTVLGMTRSLPDYACVVISANNGIQRMTKEHLGLCLALKLPFFIVVTRIDAAPENIHQETMLNINKLLKMPTVRKLPYPIRKVDDVIVSAKNLHMDRITPIFEVSNVSGTGIADLLHFINLLPVRKDWVEMAQKPKEMVIDSTFFVAGVGTVVGGIITQGTFRTNDAILIGPDGLGNFRPTQVKSIHVKGVEVSEVSAGNDAALCLKKEKRSAIRKGNVLVCPSAGPRSHWQFEGEIVILYHSTTISNNYEPVIHSNTVRQSARIMLINQDVLRTGDRAQVKFHFLYRPEYIKVGQRLIFREGRTKGIGTVTKLLDGVDSRFLGSAKQKAKEVVRQVHSTKKV